VFEFFLNKSCLIYLNDRNFYTGIHVVHGFTVSFTAIPVFVRWELIILFYVKPYLENRGDSLMMADVANLHFLIAKKIRQH